MKIEVILLAAGTSSRMGKQNKLLLPYNGMPMVRHIATKILDANPERVIVVGGHEFDELTEVLKGLPLDIIKNNRYPTGMSSSVKAGVSVLSYNLDAFMVCLSDMPMLTSADYRWLMESFNSMDKEKKILLPWDRGLPGNPVIFNACFRKEVTQMPDGPKGCSAVIAAHRELVYKIKPYTTHFFKDIDHPEDYHALGGRSD
jgi:molybdenum cofactor cytidylyltransferase